MIDKATNLKIAFITDIHLNSKGLSKLSNWITQYYNNEEKFNYCFIGGDTANCNHDKMDHDQEEMYNATVQVHRRIKDLFCCKVFFVPGNHDCKCFFNPNTKGEGFYSMHGKRVQLCEGLELVGFGGSTPGYVEGTEVWSGYPYKNDKQLASQWSKTEIGKQSLTTDNQIILLTHQGPSLSQTTVDRSQFPQRTVITGSQFLNKFVESKQIVCWLHGHTHNGSNNAKIAGVQILNPGPLTFQQFMHFEVVKENDRWRLQKKVFYKI